MKPSIENETGSYGRGMLPKNLDTTDNIYTQSGDIRLEKLYQHYFLDLPSVLKFSDINDVELLEHFQDEFRTDIIKQYSIRNYSQNKKDELIQHIFVLRDQFMVQVGKRRVNLLFISPSGTLMEQIRNLIIQYYHPLKKNLEVSVIVSESGTLKTKEIEFRKPSINFHLNYNDDFMPFHKKAMQLLRKKDESGLFLFHGKPGTGKSTYLRYLVKSLNKKVIFISPKKAGDLESVEVFKLLLDNKNSILVIEDAEELMVSRNHERNSNLSTILSLTDGILGESLAIQMIATFNTELKNIDPALVRKGRLKLAYEFTEIPPEKASKIMEERGIKTTLEEPMTLAEAYNYDPSAATRRPSMKTMGFMK